MITVARFQVPEEAHLLCSFLGSLGINAYVFDAYTVQWAWYYSDAIGGVRVIVEMEDLVQTQKECRDYYDLIRAEPQRKTVVRAWPLVLILSLVTGAPCLIFGRREL